MLRHASLPNIPSHDPFADLPLWLSRRQVAELAGVHTNTVRNWELSGLLTPLGPAGGHARYSRAEVQRLLTTQRAPLRRT